MGFIVGVDFGQQADFTAIAVVEQAGTPARYDVRHLERFPLGTPYPDVVRRLQALMWSELLHEAPLVCDATGVGRPIVDGLVQAGLDPVPVTIVAGDAASKTENGWHVPKKDLVGAVSVLLESGRLRIADALPEAATLVKELLAFKVKITTSANAIFGAWREGSHDDVVLALAMALWWAECAPGRVGAGWTAFARLVKEARR